MACAGVALAAAIPAAAQDGTGPVWFENDYVRVTRDAAPCAPAGAGCGERAIVAMGDVQLAGRVMKRGDVAVFKAGEAFATPGSGSYFEVMVKPTPPPVRAPAEMIPAPNNVLLFDGPRFFVYEEKLEVGATRERHSHSQRIEIRISQGPQLRQRIWRDGKEAVMQPPIVNWREPAIHEVVNVGDAPLRNFILEFKPGR
jgi:hypothetical protein